MPSLAKDEFTDVAVSYVAAVCCSLMNLKQNGDEEWAEVERYLSILSTNVPSGAFASLKSKCGEMMVVEEAADDDEDAEELCNCQFTLAYGELFEQFDLLCLVVPGTRRVELRCVKFYIVTCWHCFEGLASTFMNVGCQWARVHVLHFPNVAYLQNPGV